MGSGTSANNSPRTVQNQSQAASVADVRSLFSTSPLASYLSDPQNVSEARRMLRSWFLSDVMMTAAGETINGLETEDNVRLYMYLDDFISIIQNNL